MDRRMLKRHLAQAEKHVETGRKNIARQRKLIAELERDNHATRQTRAAVLVQFEELQALHTADLARMRRELGR